MSREMNLKGAEREMTVALDLMRRDFQVFRPVSTATCDLIALKYGVSLRIEVTGGYTCTSSGPITQISKYGGRSVDCRLFDVLVRCADNGEMVYLPSGFLKKNEATEDLPLQWLYNKNTSDKVRERAKDMKEKC